MDSLANGAGSAKPPAIAQAEDSAPWFEDGSVILATSSKRFKVYKGMLCQRSDVFKDMFVASQPDPSEAQDGCPVITLHDDADALQHLLFSLYGHPGPDPPRLKIIADVMGLAGKYQMDKLTNDYLFLLLRVFSLTHDEFSKSIEKPEDCILPDLRSVPALVAFVEAAESLSQPLLRRFLPVAYWLICLYASVEEVSKYVKAENVLKTWMLGRGRIIQFVITSCMSNFERKCEYSNTSYGYNCAKTRMTWMMRILSDISVGPMSWMNMAGKDLKDEMQRIGLRASCISECVSKGHISGLWNPSDKIWDKLPSSFGVSEDWKTLMEEWDRDVSALELPKVPLKC